MARVRWAAYSAIGGCSTVALSCLFSLAAFGPSRAPDNARSAELAAPTVLAPVSIAVARPRPERPFEKSYYNQLRKRLHWVEMRVGRNVLKTPDAESRMLLAKSAAQRARLSEVGLSFRDVYGLISAETSWVPRTGSSKNGTPNVGLAQFEPATAEALGVQDPNDPVEAVHAAAEHMRQAALWSRERLASLELPPKERARRLREGISVFYNLSSRGRNAWKGTNTDDLPLETQRHIQNTKLGAEEAAMLESQLRAARFGEGRTILTASREGSQG